MRSLEQRVQRAPWMTDQALALVRQMVLADSSNTNIAVAVTKQFGIQVGSSAIAGAVHRMDLPPRTHKRMRRVSASPSRPPTTDEAELFAWHTDPFPAWGTWAADEFVYQSKVRLISNAAIARKFGLDTKGIGHAIDRNRDTNRALAQASRVTRDELATLAPFITERWSMATMVRLVNLCRCGEVYATIARELHRSAVATQIKAYRLSLAGIVPHRVVTADEIAAARKARVALPTSPVSEVDGEPAGKSFSGGRQSRVGVKSSTIQWRAPTGVAAAPKAARCGWAGCQNAAVGKWCGEHADLLRRPAQEITTQLTTWRR